MVSSGRKRGRHRGRIPVFWAGWWVAGMVVWLLLTSTVDASEAIVGAGAAAIAATAVSLVWSREAIGFGLRLRWIARALRLPVRIAADTWVVTEALWLHATGRKRVRGTWWAVPFPHGDPSDPVASARRALVTVEVTIVPNSFLVGIDPERRSALVHQLVRDPGELRRLAEEG